MSVSIASNFKCAVVCSMVLLITFIVSIFGIVHCEHLKFRNIVLQKTKYRKLLFSQNFLDLCFLATESIFEFSPGTTSAA